MVLSVSSFKVSLPSPQLNSKLEFGLSSLMLYSQGQNGTFYLIDDLINIKWIECKMPAAQKILAIMTIVTKNN